ncbi:S9 family peptidase [Microbulbifer sp. ALW1]|uniref:S9 family peptidase n=1 Tax=Microbulbifer sp. (strain ALW1) TaxID=1516059 RepID=UPI0013585606|nr:S9 family peptidase [Microbulbifer sp. ALW1]
MSHSSERPKITVAPYGSWDSIITSDLLTAGNVRLSEPRLAGNCAYWLESRPAEKGRSVIVQQDADGNKRDILPAPLSTRSKAHEYGGASYLVADKSVYFVLAADQRIYHLPMNSSVPEPITAEGPCHYADLTFDAKRERLICVQEDCSGSGEPVARIVAISLKDKNYSVETLVEGADFYSNPALAPDGSQLAFLRWHHPNMPWDATELCKAEVTPSGSLSNIEQVAGGSNESLFQPQWSPDGKLYYVSDRSNWWNIYELGKNKPLWEKAAEFATPQWVFGMSTYGFLNAHEILCTFTQDGRWHLGKINLEDGSHKTIEQPFCDIEGIRCSNGQALFIGSGPGQFPAVVRYDSAREEIQTISLSSSKELPETFLSHAQAMEFSVDNRQVHAFYYPPCNPNYVAPEGEKPPTIVFSHGGPTGATSAGLNLKIQYWTSRGFAILDVNYSGSTGYGRAYRDRLKDTWGITDVEDVCAGAEFLVAQGLADPQRLLIKGGSAGGYTVLAALTFHNTFSAGASHYGIGDLTTLARDTHKFESRYLDKLVGPWPEAESIYRDRSPINHIEQLNCPVIFFQGMEDKVVPPNQAEAMVAALKQRGLPVAYITFSEEGHGFRAASSIQMALEGELEFYSRIFHFPLAKPGPGIRIDNLGD